MEQGDVIAYDSRFAYDHTHAVVNKHSVTNGRAGVAVASVGCGCLP